MAYDQEKINGLLRDSAGSPLENGVKQEMKRSLQAASNRMQPLWAEWDNQAWIYRGWRLPDRKDANAVEKGEPPKIIIPISFAQIQTALSFIFSTFTQRTKFYELEGRSPSDDIVASGLEIDLDWQMTYNRMLFKAYLWILDALKMGFGVVKTQWGFDFEKRRIGRQVHANPMGAIMAMLGRKPTMKTIEEVAEIPIYEGNKITNISPYSWFPDPDFPLHEFDKGAFVGHEEEESLSTIRGQEGKLYHGTDKIPRTYQDDLWMSRPRRTTMMRDGFDKSLMGRELMACIRTEMIIQFSPKNFSERFGIDPGLIGAEDYPVKFIATMANDQKLIRFERYNYLHDKFGYSFMEYSPDYNGWYNPGLSSTISALQSLMTWFLNSHVAEVKKSIYNRFIYVEDRLVQVDDIEGGKNIRVTPGVSGNLEEVIKQLQVTDLTRGHVQDIETLYKIIQIVTGINDNTSGQYAPGRRSATESRAVGAGAASRLQMHAQLNWLQGFQPLGRQLIANTRQGRSKKFYDRILGDASAQYPYEKVILTDPQQIAGEFDMLTYDATLPSGKDRQIQILMEPLTAMLQNPAAAQLIGGNPGMLLDHIMKLAGINDWARINAGVGASNPAAAAAAAAALDPSIQVVPDDQAAEARDNGATPVDTTGEDIFRAFANGQGAPPQQ
jgi:hypothetical protein